MQALFIFIVFTIQNVLSDDPELAKYNDLKYKSYKDLLHPKVAIWSSKWQAKKKSMPHLYTKKPYLDLDPENRFYTAFAPVDPYNKNVDIPDSPFFPIDHHFQQRTRIKKVLPEYYPSLSRVRRSAHGDPSQVKPDDKQVSKSPTPKTKTNNVVKAKTNPKPNAKRRVARRPQNKNQVLRRRKQQRRIASNPKSNPGNRKRRNQGKKQLRNKNNQRAKGDVARSLKRGNKAVKNQQRKGPAKNAQSKTQKMQPKTNKNSKEPKPNAKAAVKKPEPVSKPAIANLNQPAAGNPKADNIRKKGTRRLISSRDADIEEFPYVVSIQKDSEHWCSGALLNQRLVITTANCVWKSSSLSRMRIRAGSRFTDHGGQKAKIQEVMKHPRWSIRSQPDNDVALLLLDRDLKFSDSIHAADLPNRIMMPPFNDAWVTSWGTERRDGIYKHSEAEKTLQIYHTRLMDQRKCGNITKRYGVAVTENFICLAQDGHRAPCTRDTGAPAVSDGILWGLASWSIRKLCGTESFPAMFSYLGSVSNLEFIMNATRYLMAEYREDPFPDRLPRGMGMGMGMIRRSEDQWIE